MTLVPSEHDSDHGVDADWFVRVAPLEPRNSVMWFTVCAWCERVKIRGRWIEDEAAQRLLPLQDGRLRFTHGICDSCFTDVTARRNRHLSAS